MNKSQSLIPFYTRKNEFNTIYVKESEIYEKDEKC